MSGLKDLHWLASAATLLSLVACYGTLAAVAAPGAIGIGMAFNETVWSGAIVVFAVLTEAVLLLRAGTVMDWRVSSDPAARSA